MRTVKNHYTDIHFTNSLASKSTLFERGMLKDASNENFVLRLNALIAARAYKLQVRPPKDLESAILSKSKLSEHAELVVFGKWLRNFGMSKTRGRKPDFRLTMKSVAAGMLEIRKWSKDQSIGDVKIGDPLRITKNVLARRWDDLFQENTKPSVFDARLRTMQRLLPAYLDDLKAGVSLYKGKPIKKSPQLEQLLEAISGTGLKHEKPEIQSGKPPIVSAPKIARATVKPFKIDLCYSSVEQEAAYRNLPAGKLELPKLSYRIDKASSKSPSGKIRKDLQGRLVLQPELPIRKNFKVQALIDRMAILIDTHSIASRERIKKAIKLRTGADLFVYDRAINQTGGETGWCDQLPKLDLSKKAGQHFAIMVQEPDPDKIAAILKVINGEWGIDGAVVPYLLELSIDFRAIETNTPEEAILLREQIVGLLQRHHWASHKLLLENAPGKPVHADARQVYGIGGNTRYLFSRDKSDRVNTDSEVKRSSVRARIMQGKSGNDIYLDATVYKGVRHSGFLISIQHKIADQRNPSRNTLKSLPQKERRARIEVTITGLENLKNLGLEKIDDLAVISFRKMRKSLLNFNLGTCAPQQHLLVDAIQQMRSRGVYGLELKERAKHQQERRKQKQTDGKLPRCKDREGLGLVAWNEMNVIVGDALDSLEKRWKNIRRAT